MDINTRDQLLNLMRALESSNNTNIAHKQMTSGIQSGDTAYGQYGLMPNTVKEMAQRRNIQGIGDKMDSQIQNIDNPVMSSVLTAHPELEQRYAEDLANKTLDKSNRTIYF